ncbi:MAG: hypothetical protein EPN89_15890 [Methylovulum sp.]|nr:MAG: hypothetical protein EPN89_15890 [Methylovulum sp.]
MIDRKLLENLEHCLNDIVPNDEHFGIEEIRGLFYAQMITPDNTLGSIKNNPLPWLSALFYGERPKLSEEQVNGLNASAGAVYEAYSALLAANKLDFPFDFDRLDADMAELAYAWCQGFFIGLSINEVFWLGKKGEKLKSSDKELEAVRNSAKLFTGLATKDFSDFDKLKIAELKAFIIEQGQQPSNDLIAASLFPNVPIAVKTLQMYGTKLMRAAAQKTEYQSAQKIGRNDPCHCGSGKKYKKCCGS